MKTYKAYYKSPLGPIEIVGAQDSILSLDFVDKELAGDADLPFCLKTCLKQIDEYFSGKRKEFLLKLDPQGTNFQKLVWQQLEKIPYGAVVSYGEIASVIGKPKACRAVGSANGRNPIAIIIPCFNVCSFKTSTHKMGIEHKTLAKRNSMINQRMLYEALLFMLFSFYKSNLKSTFR